MMTKALLLALSMMTPRFVGIPRRDFAPPEMSPRPAAVMTYMTAAEMKAQVAALTGYEHPGFDRYADVLGKYDPTTGQRTVDKPSLLSVLFMKQIAESVATYVVEREAFLDDDERVVFQHVDLTASPTDAALDEEVDALYTKWLGQPPGGTTATALHRQFRAAESAQGAYAGYERLLAMMLQHGGLYYY